MASNYLKRFKWLISNLKKEIAKYKIQHVLKQRVRNLRSKGDMVKLVIGASSTSYKGWLVTDLPVLDALKPADWGYIFPQGSIDRILAEHVIEHWTEEEFRSFLGIVRPFVSRAGFIRIAVPDGFHPAPSYIDYVKPGGSGIGAEDHKVLYNYITITRILSGEHYDYNLLEYFDEMGQFHCCKWEIKDGFIKRSADYDPRNKEQPLSYTSLIIDAWSRGDKYGL